MKILEKIAFTLAVSGVLALSVWLAVANSKGLSERSYQDRYCKGLVEWRLPDKTRVDCLTHTHAIEFDFSNKWAEAIGQSLHYANVTNKRAGIYLIMLGKRSVLHNSILRQTIKAFKLPIDVWLISP